MICLQITNNRSLTLVRARNEIVKAEHIQHILLWHGILIIKCYKMLFYSNSSFFSFNKEKFLKTWQIQIYTTLQFILQANMMGVYRITTIINFFWYLWRTIKLNWWPILQSIGPLSVIGQTHRRGNLYLSFTSPSPTKILYIIETHCKTTYWA